MLVEVAAARLVGLVWAVPDDIGADMQVVAAAEMPPGEPDGFRL